MRSGGGLLIAPVHCTHSVDVRDAVVTSGSNLGASRRRKVCSATSSVFQITPVAFSTFLNRLAAAVRSRTAANGDSTGFVVRRCFQCSWRDW